MKSILLSLLLLASALCARADSFEMKRGPACRIVKMTGRFGHMIHLYVTPAPTSSSYTPGKIRLYLVGPQSILNAPLALDKQEDGRLHVRFYLKRNSQEGYRINVIDEQEGQELALFSGSLVEIPDDANP